MATDRLPDLEGACIWVAGNRGMVGLAIVRRLAAYPVVAIFTVDRTALDLRRQSEVEA
jgi:nucleoside-diphosphate-sugar epimerase